MTRRIWAWIAHWRWQLRWRRLKWPRSKPNTLADSYLPEERRALVLSLRQHPGFQLLMADLVSRKARFEERRERFLNTIPEDIDPQLLKSTLLHSREAIRWLGWLESQTAVALDEESWQRAQANSPPPQAAE